MNLLSKTINIQKLLKGASDTMKIKILPLSTIREALRNYQEKSGINKSDFRESAILNDLPKYAPLHDEAMGLLNCQNADDPSGNPYYEIRQCLINTMRYIRDNHHIKDNTVLRKIMMYFVSSPYRPGIPSSSLNVHELDQRTIEKAKEKLKEIDSQYYYCIDHAGLFAHDILNHWKEMWDLDISYDVLITVIGHEPFDLNCVECIEEDTLTVTMVKLLKNLEVQIIED